MDVLSEIDIELLAEAEESGALPTTPPLETNDANLTEYLTNLIAVTNGLQTFDPFDVEWLNTLPDAMSEIDPTISDWLADFLGDAVDDEAVYKSKTNFADDDEDEDEVITTGPRITGSGGSIGDYSGFGTTTLGVYDGDSNQGDPNGPPTDQDEDVVFVHGTKVQADSTSTFILRGSDGSFSFHHNGGVYESETDWLDAIWDSILQTLEDETVIVPPSFFPFIDEFEALPPAVQRGIIEFLCGCSLPTPG